MKFKIAFVDLFFKFIVNMFESIDPPLWQIWAPTNPFLEKENYRRKH
jgi:hypothetical protein